MVLVITTAAGPIGGGTSIQGTSTVALTGDLAAVGVLDPATSNLLTTGTKLTQFDGLWDVVLEFNDGVFVGNDGPGAAQGVPVRLQADIIRAGVVIDTLTDAVIWTYDPVTRLGRVVSLLVAAQLSTVAADIAALNAQLVKVLNGVYTGTPP